MLFLHFEGHAPYHHAKIGPAAAFQVSGNFIRDAASQQVLARYEKHFWHVEGQAFTRYDCKSPVLIHFEDADRGKTEAYGPFDYIWVADGSLYVKQDVLFAKFVDQTLLWHNHETDTYWPLMVLTEP